MLLTKKQINKENLPANSLGLLSIMVLFIKRGEFLVDNEY